VKINCSVMYNCVRHVYVLQCAKPCPDVSCSNSWFYRVVLICVVCCMLCVVCCVPCVVYCCCVSCYLLEMTDLCVGSIYVLQCVLQCVMSCPDVSCSNSWFCCVVLMYGYVLCCVCVVYMYSIVCCVLCIVRCVLCVAYCVLSCRVLCMHSTGNSSKIH